jgi:hypothetical protein
VTGRPLVLPDQPARPQPHAMPPTFADRSHAHLFVLGHTSWRDCRAWCPALSAMLIITCPPRSHTEAGQAIPHPPSSLPGLWLVLVHDLRHNTVHFLLVVIPAGSQQKRMFWNGNSKQELRSLRDLTQHLKTRADDSHAPPVSTLHFSGNLKSGVFPFQERSGTVQAKGEVHKLFQKAPTWLGGNTSAVG